MFQSVVVKAPCHLAIPSVLRFAHFYLHSIPANLATPECTWYFPMNMPLFLSAVTCWNCPSLLLPVPAQFKDLSFLKAFSWAKIDSSSPMLLMPWWFHFMHWFYLVLDILPRFLYKFLREEVICHSGLCPSQTPTTPQHMTEGLRILNKGTVNCTKLNSGSRWVMVILGHFNPGACQAIFFSPFFFLFLSFPSSLLFSFPPSFPPYLPAFCVLIQPLLFFFLLEHVDYMFWVLRTTFPFFSLKFLELF